MKRSYTKDEYMKKALDQAKRAYKAEEIPVGAIIVKNDEIIARGYNHKESKKNALRHAGIEAIEKALKKTGSKYLDDCEMYVTLEPCPMCAGAIVLSRVKRVIFGADDPKGGCCGTLMNLVQDERFNHQAEVTENVLAEECGQLLTDFFRALRESKKQERLNQRGCNPID